MIMRNTNQPQSLTKQLNQLLILILREDSKKYPIIQSTTSNHLQLILQRWTHSRKKLIIMPMSTHKQCKKSLPDSMKYQLKSVIGASLNQLKSKRILSIISPKTSSINQSKEIQSIKVKCILKKEIHLILKNTILTISR